MPDHWPPAEPLTVDRLEIDVESRTIRRGDRAVSVQELPLRLLLTLNGRPGEVVSRAELQDALWSQGTYVDRDAGLNTAVRKLRAALRDLGDDGRSVQTVPRTGYRLRLAPMARAAGSTNGEPPRRERATSWDVPAAFAMVALVLTVILAMRTGGSFDTESSGPMPESDQHRAWFIEARSLMFSGAHDFERARDLLRALVDAAPEFGPGHAYLAEASVMASMLEHRPEDLAATRRAIDRAERVDPGSAVAHRARGMLALHFDWNLQRARTEVLRALAIAPRDPINYLVHAFVASTVGDHESAIESVRRAVDLAPESMIVRSDAGYFMLRAGRFRDAAEACAMILRLDPGHGFGRDCLLTASDALGDTEAARSHALALLEDGGAPNATLVEAATTSDPRRVVVAWRLGTMLASADPPAVKVAIAHQELGDEARSLTWLEKAARERAPLLVVVPRSPVFARLTGDPRFIRIFRDAGLAELVHGTAQPGRTIIGRHEGW